VAGRLRGAGAAPRALVGGSVHAGEAQVDSLVDAVGSFATYEGVFPGATEEDWAPWRQRHPELFEGEAWRLPFRSFLIRTAGRVVLVDTGVGPAGGGDWLPDRQGWLLEELARVGVPPDAVDTVFLTHVHVDHVGWNHAFERARFVAHRDSIPLSAERGRPLPERTDAVEGEAELAPGVVAFEAPGHLPGHMGVRVGDEVALLGDVAVHPAQLVRPGLVYTADGDPERCAETRREVLARYGDRILGCGHFPGTGFGRLVDGVWTPPSHE
jgi:glyoxylase-like metal-dependent hydrolase (beta-lactamase superfamily II)